MARGMRTPNTRAHLQIECADRKTATHLLDVLVLGGLEGGANREGAVIQCEAFIDDIVAFVVRERRDDVGRVVKIHATHPYRVTVAVELPDPPLRLEWSGER